MELFVYGTLLFPELRNKILQKEVKSVSAELFNYQVVVLRHVERFSEYPVLIKSNETKVRGEILIALNDSDMDILNFYEGDEYILKEVSVLSEKEIRNVPSYMPRENFNFAFGPSWDREYFQKTFLQSYLKHVIPDTLTEYDKKYGSK